MAKLNLYKIDENKKEGFFENLKGKLNFINKKELYNSKGKKCELSLYNFFPDFEDKQLSWNWLLNEFDENTFRYKANPRAIVTIIQGNEVYVITFGSAYFIVDKFCNRKFAFEFAKRSEYSNIKTTALNAPNSQRNKVINSYNKCSSLIYDSGESYSKIKANMKVDEEETRFNGTIEIGTSIRFSMKENTLENIIKIIDYVEETLSKEVIHNIPLFLEVEKDRIKELDIRLIENIKNKNVEVKFSEFDIVGVDETFYHNDSGFTIGYGENEEVVDELNCENVNEFIKKNNINDECILNIKIEVNSDDCYIPVQELRNLIDFTDDKEKVVISNGIWYEYNDDYLRYLKESINELEIEYETKYDKFDIEYLKYIDNQYEKQKNSSEYSAKSETEVKAELKRKLYKERAFNLLREENDGFENHDRETENVDGNKYELMDLYKDKTIYAVKIGNSSSKLCYALDQSIIGMKMLKNKTKRLDVEKIGVWLILERKKKLKVNRGTIDLNSLDMLMLKNRIDSWKKEVRLAGYKPVVRINYSK